MSLGDQRTMLLALAVISFLANTESATGRNAGQVCSEPAFLISVSARDPNAASNASGCSPFAAKGNRSLTAEEMADASQSGVAADCWIAAGNPCSSLALALAAMRSFIDDDKPTDTSFLPNATLVVRLDSGLYLSSEFEHNILNLTRGAVVLMKMNYTRSYVAASGANLTAAEAPVLQCDGAAASGAGFFLLTVSLGARFSLLGVVVQRCHSHFALLVVRSASLRMHDCTFRSNEGQIVASFNSQLDVSRTLFLNNSVSATALRNSSLDIVSFYGGPVWKSGVMFIIYNEPPASAYGRNNESASSHPPAYRTRITDSWFELCGCLDGVSISSETQIASGFLDGAAIGVLLESSLAEVSVAGTMFKGNVVCGRGGGIYCDVAENGASNRVAITNCTFLDNWSNEEGAGLSIKVVSTTSNNSILVTDSSFLNNYATSAAGVDVLFDPIWAGPGIPVSPELGKQFIRFLRCVFSGNRAFVGSPSFRVRGHYSLHRYAQRVLVQDCTFRTSSCEENAYAASFLAVQANVEFYGTSRFLDNNVTALMFETANMFVGGKIVFTGNRAQMGGGMRIRMVSQVYMTEGSQLEFYKNYAHIAGGGIFWEGPPAATRRAWFRFNPDCIFVYAENRQTFPDDWKFNISFVENSAGKTGGGGAVYATSLSLCSWTGYTVRPFHDIHRALQWSFVYYRDNYVRTGGKELGKVLNDISTVAYSITSSNTPSAATTGPDKNVVTIPRLPPGESYPLNVYALDELGQRVAYMVYMRPNTSNVFLPADAFFTHFDYNTTASSPSSDKDAIETQDDDSTVNMFDYVIRPQHHPGAINFTFTLRDNNVFQSSNDHVLVVKETSCAVGFSLQCTGQRCSCVCTSTDADNEGLVRCVGHQIFALNTGYFLAVSADSTKFEIVPCPNNFCACRTQRGAETAQEAADQKLSLETVPNNIPAGRDYLQSVDVCLVNVIRAQDTSYLCNAQRTGPLCGKCLSDLSFHKHSYNCQDCSNVGASQWRLPVVVVCSVVVLLLLAKFKAYVPSRFFGFVIFAQYSQYNHIASADQDWVVRVGLYVEDLVSMRWWFDQCLFPRETAVTILSLGMLPAAIALATSLLVALLCISHKVYTLLKLNPDRAVATSVHVWLVVYGGVLLHSFRLLHCVPVLGDRVLFLDGSVTCFDELHLRWGVLAIITILMVGIVGPLLVWGLAAGKLRRKSRVSEILCSELRHDMHWWWLVEFGARFVLSACVGFWAENSMMLLLVPVILFMALVALLEPYSAFLDNVLATFFLLDLAVVETLRSPRIRSTLNDSTGYRALQAMAFLPYVVVLLVAVHYLVSRFRNKSEEMTWRMRVPHDDVYDIEEEAYRSGVSASTTRPHSPGSYRRGLTPGPASIQDSTRMRRITRKKSGTMDSRVGLYDTVTCSYTGLRDPLLADEMWQLESGKG